LDAGRTHDSQVDLLAIDDDRFLRHIRFRQIQLDARLRTDEYVARIGRRQLLDRLAAAGFQRFEKFLRVVFDTGAAGCKGVADGETQYGEADDFFERGHDDVCPFESDGRSCLAVYTMVSVTSMLPRVALEYGQTMCALSTSACAAARSMPGSEIFSSTSIAKPVGT